MEVIHARFHALIPAKISPRLATRPRVLRLETDPMVDWRIGQMKGLKSIFHLNQEIKTDFTKMQKLFYIQ